MIVTFNQLKEIKNNNDKKIIICAGWFDMFHYGHLCFLNGAKNNGDTLVVVVMNDVGIKPLKGEDRPVINEKQRIAIVDNIKAVDYTILSSSLLEIEPLIEKYKITTDYKERLLWKEYIPIIMELRPNIVFSLFETLNFVSLQRKLAENNIQIMYTKYTEGISTTSITKKL